jgi:hypothetical protein
MNPQESPSIFLGLIPELLDRSSGRRRGLVDTQAAIVFIRETLRLEAVLYFEVHVDSPKTVAEVANAMQWTRGCTAVAYPFDRYIKISRRTLAKQSEPPSVAHVV